MTHTLIHHFLEESARVYPDKIALIHEDVRAAYAEINGKADQLAHWLIEMGVALGDRVVLLLENSLEYVVSYYGVLKAGAVAVPLSTDLKPDGLRPLLAELEPRVIISAAKFERVLQATDLSQFPIEALLLKTPKMDWSSLPFSLHSWDELLSCPLSVVKFSFSRRRSAVSGRQRYRFGQYHLHLGLDRKAQGSDAFAPKHRFQYPLHLPVSGIDGKGYSNGGPALLLRHGQVTPEHSCRRRGHCCDQQQVCFPCHGDQSDG